jgi:proteasome lid subunit RPN8/RPN11
MGLLLAAASAPAANYPVAIVGADAVCHESIQAAATAGLFAAAARSRKVEYGGAVFQRDSGCFVHSIPVTSNQPARLDYLVRITRGGMVLVGIYHTHTPGRHAEQFSEADIEAQRSLGVPSCIGALRRRQPSITIRCLTGTAGAGSTAAG